MYENPNMSYDPETKNPEKKKSGKNLQYYPYNEGEQIVIFHKYVVLTSSTIS